MGSSAVRAGGFADKQPIVGPQRRGAVRPRRHYSVNPDPSSAAIFAKHSTTARTFGWT
jgi:hypothetical protein